MSVAVARVAARASTVRNFFALDGLQFLLSDAQGWGDLFLRRK
jgi:hypothetical protein